MALAIVRRRQLRTGDLEFTATTASDVDQYIVVVNEHCTKAAMAELWVATGGYPIPKGTLKQLGTNYLICDRLSFKQEGSQSLIWHVNVHWKEIEEDDPQDQTNPTPNSGSLDPADWTPSWQRRSVIIHTDAHRAYYRSGFTASTAAALASTYNVAPARKMPLMNSSCQPVLNSGVTHQRRMSVWSFRWLREDVPDSLVDAEGKINSELFTFELGGRSWEWEEETALVDSVNVSKQRWGNISLVQIEVDILHDPEGHQWEILDFGTAAKSKYGDCDGNGGTVAYGTVCGRPDLRSLRDDDDRHIQDPVFLDGTGQPLAAGSEPIYIEWMDFESVDFNGVNLLEDLA